MATSHLFKLSQLLSHRGPDEHKLLENEFAKVIHHRLSITGGDTNQQPITFEDGGIFVFNGELYNTLELISRFKLKANPDDDAQVFAEIWYKFGGKYLTEIDGVFAGAYLSKRQKKLYLFRDRFGARPLYYRQQDLEIFFSSEMQPLVEISETNTLNFEALYDFMLVNMPLNSETIMKDIFEVPPATLMSFDLNSGKVTRESFEYWQYNWSTEKYSIAELRERLEHAVVSQIPKNVQCGSYLSGGIDSSLLAYFLSREIPDLRTYTLAFDGFSDEYETARQTATLLGSNLSRVVFSQDYALSNIHRVLDSIQSPRVGQSLVNFCIHEAASRENKVTFSGAGADELFGGYPWRYPLLVEKNLVIPQSLSYLDSLQWVLGKWGKMGDKSVLQELFPSVNFTSIIDDRMSRLQLTMPSSLFDPTDPWAAVKLSMRFDQMNFLPHLLTVDDSLAMQFGLEVRVPYLSNSITSYASQIPITSLFGVNSIDGSILGKMPLREIADSVFGSRLSGAGKLGFSAPSAIWANPLGMDLLAKSNEIWNFVEKGYFEKILLGQTNLDDRQIASIVWGTYALSHQVGAFKT